ncbi:flagellar hook-associated protein FlgL [Helicobacter sp. MIT 14-3879]|uniref:flagellar hook-associated protein FlgL n=1 Tax=Helicobacter sp. MIT 14-3879 TaxID=2040649 RepID=UPI000E1F50E3|nr:flagellar hook-associated protein FlgL [Helicobacter sp. MIT 14-3879]RDU63495.1 flagellar hook-associated protein FlgL [Helicobacter sp. MIT 14-3879]
MRVTFGTKYNQMDYYQNTLQNKLNEANTKIASGLKIKYGYEDSSIFNQNLKMEYDIHSLNQSIDIANDANTHTLNTDKSLSEISKALDDFKTKLIHAGNDIHSPTSREAIANDMKGIRDHILSIANTSIGGEYIFAGSRIKVKPFNDDGSYNGNNEKLEALIAPDIKSAYNINGKELFFSRDLDKFKTITSNIQKLNQSKLHPDIMDKMNKTNVPSEVFITSEDTLRDLIGDNDNDTSNDEVAYFYLRGKRPDGTSFKTKFALDVAYDNPQNATRVSDLLRKIGEAYGNTSQNQVVDVKLNNWGQIEITEVKPGGSNIDFHLISSNKDVEDINSLHQIGARVTSFQKSPFLSDFSLSKVVGIKNNYDARYTTLGVEFITNDNEYASKNTKLSDIFGLEATKLEISGKSPNNKTGNIEDSVIKPFEIDIQNNTIDDLLKSIQNHFGGNISVEISNGKINIIDHNVISLENDKKDPPFNGPSGFEIELKTIDDNGDERNAIRNSFQTTYDKSAFLNKGSSLLSNVSQINALSGEYATDSTKLSEVANKDLNGEKYILKLKDHNGIDVEASIELNEDGTYLLLPNNNSGDGNYRIPLYNPHDRPPAISISSANDVTYRQILDSISIALNYSNQDVQNFLNAQGNNIDGVSEIGKKNYEKLVNMANGNVNVMLNDEGQVEIQDKIRSKTKMSFMMYSNSSDDFSLKGLDSGAPSITLNANNALEVDKPHISFFKQLDSMIDAVRKGIYRPDALGDNYNQDLRNIGIQNSIALFDHINDHIEKNIALNGSYGRVFENSIKRNEVLKVQVESIKSDTIGTDLAETYNKFSQLTNNYNAVLASTSKINQMSLVDFL